MAFHEKRLPINPTWQTSGGPGFNTNVEILHGGYDNRNPQWDSELRAYAVQYEGSGPNFAGDFRNVLAAFLNKGGARVGFRFKDPSDYTGASDFIGVGDGSTRKFQLYKNYTSDVIEYDILKADTGNNKITCKDIDTFLLDTDQQSHLKVNDSTGNDGWYKASAVVTESYTISGGTASPPVAYISGDVSGEFEENQLVELTDNTDTDDDGERNILDITYNGGAGRTEITFLGADFDAAPNGNLNGNTTITVSPGISDSTADGKVQLFWQRKITKPVSSVALDGILVNGVAKTEGTDYTVDYKTGVIIFVSGSTPASGHRIITSSTNYEFDVPVFIEDDNFDPTFRDYGFSPFTLNLRETRTIR